MKSYKNIWLDEYFIWNINLRSRVYSKETDFEFEIEFLFWLHGTIWKIIFWKLDM